MFSHFRRQSPCFLLTTSAVCSVCAVVRFKILQTCSYILKRFLMVCSDYFCYSRHVASSFSQHLADIKHCSGTCCYLHFVSLDVCACLSLVGFSLLCTVSSVYAVSCVSVSLVVRAYHILAVFFPQHSIFSYMLCFFFTLLALFLLLALFFAC